MGILTSLSLFVWKFPENTFPDEPEKKYLVLDGKLGFFLLKY